MKDNNTGIELCKGCIYSDCNDWFEAEKDTCGVCKQGSERKSKMKTGCLVECPECRGDGKETCTNPDHGLIGALSFRDEGRNGCPVCGHDPKCKVPNGGDCEICSGSGMVTESKCEEYMTKGD